MDPSEQIPASEDSSEFRISNAKVIGILAAGLIFLFTYIANNIINSPHSRIDSLADKIERLSEKIDNLQFELVQDNHDILDCVRHNERQQGTLDELTAWLKKHERWGLDMTAKTQNWRGTVDQRIEHLERMVYGNNHTWAPE